MTIKRRLMVTLGALGLAIVMAMPAAGAAGKPIKVPDPTLPYQKPPCLQLELKDGFVWAGGEGSCVEAMADGAKVMWPANDAPPGIHNSTR